MVLTNVIGFDVKAWDPGAPVRAFPDPQSGQVVIVKPGDPRYAEALANPAQQIVAYGAYVDLGWSNYDPNYNPAQGAPVPAFWNYYGNIKSLLANGSLPSTQWVPVYDSGCFSYENEGIYSIDNLGNRVPVSVPNYPPAVNVNAPFTYPPVVSQQGIAHLPAHIIDLYPARHAALCLEWRGLRTFFDLIAIRRIRLDAAASGSAKAEDRARAYS